MYENACFFIAWAHKLMNSKSVESILSTACYQLDGSLFDLEQEQSITAAKKLCERFGFRLLVFVLERDSEGDFVVKNPSAVILPRRTEVKDTLTIGLYSEKKHWELITNYFPTDPREFDWLTQQNRKHVWVLEPCSVVDSLNDTQLKP